MNYSFDIKTLHDLTNIYLLANRDLMQNNINYYLAALLNKNKVAIYKEENNIKGFIIYKDDNEKYEINSTECEIIEMHFNTKNNMALFKTIRPIIKRYVKIKGITPKSNHKINKFYDRLGLKKEELGGNFLWELIRQA